MALKKRFGWLVSVPFLGVQIAAIIGVALLGFSWKGLGLAAALFFGRLFFVTAGYHRYFSHRTYKTSRWFQFLLALGAQTSVQKGVLWWSAHHRAHHKYSDTPQDPHSYRDYGFFYAHMGWIINRETENTDEKWIGDLVRYPELRWLNKYHVVPGVVLAVVLWLAGGWFAFVWGFLVSTTLLWHGTFTINSLSHVWGYRRYETTDESKNNPLLAILTLGEGWHNNHHYYQRSARQGFLWWQYDITYYILLLLSAVGLVRDLHTPSADVIAGNFVDPASRRRKSAALAAIDIANQEPARPTLEADAHAE
ncbi:MAG: acyl-CoA desaturase [Polyangiaceae bacterium]|nr:acyl-CoA desaturase [Polyangiaceae bacterium]